MENSLQEIPGAQVQHWDEWNSKYRQPETLEDEPSRRRMREVLSALVEFEVHSAKLLEVGCGTGWLSRRLTDFGTVTAVDLGKEIINAAKARNPEIDYRSGDIQSIDLPLHFFDVIITLETFSHVPDQPAFLHRLFQLLKPGGLLLLTTQNRWVFERVAGIGPAVGYLRKWADLKTVKRMLMTEFSIQRATTLEPDGHLGFLRVVNSRKINGILNRILGAPRVKSLKEHSGFGQTIFVISRKR